MVIGNAKLFLDGKFQEGSISFENGVITEIGPANAPADVDAQGKYVVPGFVDVHTHGAMGEDFSDGKPEGLAPAARHYAAHGVTSFLATTMTLKEEVLTPAMHTIGGFQRPADGAKCAGIHLEGPFLSYAKRGAQNGDWLHAPDAAMLRRLMDAAEGLVKLVSVAPEEPGAMEFISQVAEDVNVAVAHTTADYDTALEAFRRGARQVTHLFNAMPNFTHRAPGVVGAALDSPWSRVELICDGIHIHPSVVRAVFKMFGPDRVVLISDTMRAAGMTDGKYDLGGQEVTVKGPLATLADGTIAGSVTDLMACLKTAVSFGIPLADAVRAAAVNSAQAIGVFDRVGSLEPGKRANVVVLDGELNVKNVFFHGKQVV